LEAVAVGQMLKRTGPYSPPATSTTPKSALLASNSSALDILCFLARCFRSTLERDGKERAERREKNN